MDIKQIQAMGGFIPRTLFKREIKVSYKPPKPESEWADPQMPEREDKEVEATMTTWIRKKSSADFMEMIVAPDRDKAHIAIFRCVCNEDGSQLFESLEQTQQVDEWLFVPLMLAVNEVNQFGLKNSQPKTSSGAMSLSPSAKRLRNAKPNSLTKKNKRGAPIATSAENSASV